MLCSFGRYAKTFGARGSIVALLQKWWLPMSKRIDNAKFDLIHLKAIHGNLRVIKADP